jgi:hypothetical protein
MEERAVLRFSFETDAEMCRNCGFIPAKSAAADARRVFPGKMIRTIR